jgi:hypothetical protein
MRNPRCGYDFVDRLKDRGDFLENAFNGGKKGNKAKQTVSASMYRMYVYTGILYMRVCVVACRRQGTCMLHVYVHTMYSNVSRIM